MSWIKRNLFFLIGGGVAVALLSFAGFYAYSNWKRNRGNLESLEAAYGDWERIVRLNPNPGNNKVDNIQLAIEQQKQVKSVMDRTGRVFEPIAPVPNPQDGNVTKEEFASALRRTVDQLQKDASQTGVTIPPRYDFSFQAQRNLPNFAAGSLKPLAAQLGDVRTICRLLFDAKVNSLEGIRRERVSTDDNNGPQSDYLEPMHGAVTNELAVLVPYVVRFQCFSAELASVLDRLGSSPHGIIVKMINVDPASTPAPTDPSLGGAGGYAPPTAGYGAAGYPGGPAVAPATRGGPQTVLDEKPLKVTVVLNVVRLLPRT